MSRTTKATVAILTARHGKKAASPVTGTIVAQGVTVVREGGAATVEIGETGATGVEEVRATETVGPGMTTETAVISGTNVEDHAPTGTTTVPGTIAAKVVHADLPVAMMGADGGRARHVDVSPDPSGQHLTKATHNYDTMSPEITVAVNGALGRMGSTVLAAVAAEDGVAPVGGADIAATADTVTIAGTSASVPLAPSLSTLFETVTPDVVVDFTNGEAAKEAIITGVEAGVKVVSGSTGLTAEDLDEIGQLAAEREVGVISASNFALGAVVMMHLAGIASKYFDYADLIETHHEAKVDAPSGTALSIAKAMIDGRGSRFDQNTADLQTLEGTRGGDYQGINIHSARMQGRVARHEVVFGALGQTLTLIHDSINRESFMPGVMLAVKRVVNENGLIVGLDSVLGLGKPKP
ncbi:MAG: 4-hydroxy-tetrahydrodipicolinate reductase [Chloroflexi bacterium]|nr:4-hydroxy-tetrahydrodipicolinate reductase [Chloroflexota bacterium]